MANFLPTIQKLILFGLAAVELCVGKLPSTIKIGAIFESEYSDHELAFKYAIKKINERRDLLPYTKLTYDIQQAPPDDSFMASKKVCKQIREGVAAIFGPLSRVSASHIQSICDALEIPHVEARWNFRNVQDYFSINVYPYYRKLSQAYLDAIVHWRWSSFTILYQSDEGLIRLQDLMRAPTLYDVKVTVRRIESVDDGDLRPILKEIQKRGDNHIVIDCDLYTIKEVLKQAQSINMMTQYYHYFLATLDLGLVHLDDYKYGGTNITAYRLIKPDWPPVSKIEKEWRTMQLNLGVSPLENEYGFTTETALIYDAVHLFAKALDAVGVADDVHVESLSCAKPNSWKHGNTILNYMKAAQIEGLTGKLNYLNGQRSGFELDLIQLEKDKMEKIGTWRSDGGLNITKTEELEIIRNVVTLRNKTLMVTTILEAPYMMLVKDPGAVGNDRYEGYCKDMLDAIAALLKFNYTIKLVSDNKYGAPGKNGEWNGMVKELIDRKADLAVASLTISYVREQVIDFTKPFMTLGISILFKRPVNKTPSLFSFLSPLSFDIWIYMLAAYLTVSFVLFVLARFSPYEWYNPHPCNPDSDIVENQFTLLNSLWFTIGSLMQQGSDIAPRAISTRLVSGTWWLFALIMISSYTANLAAFLTVERMTSPIENADDLVKQTKIKYGSLNGGSTETFFKKSNIEIYKKMYEFMQSAKPTVFTATTEEGIRRVKKGDYAFLLESTMNEYNQARDCDLIQVGGLLDNKGYGIGTPRDSPYRDIISSTILQLQESQKLQVFKNKWWQKNGGKCDAENSEKKKDANALAIENVGGVFLVLVIGLTLAFIVALIEFVWKLRKTHEDERNSVCKEISDELKFAVQCCGESEKSLKKSKIERLRPDVYREYQIDNGDTIKMPLNAYSMEGHREYYR